MNSKYLVLNNYRSLIESVSLRYLIIECEEQENNGKQDTRVRDIYVNVLKMFSEKLHRGGTDLQKRRQYLQRQKNFIDKLVQLVKVICLDK